MAAHVRTNAKSRRMDASQSLASSISEIGDAGLCLYQFGQRMCLKSSLVIWYGGIFYPAFRGMEYEI